MAVFGCCRKLSSAARLAVRRLSTCACICALVGSQHVLAATYSRGFALDSLNLPSNNSQAAAYAIDLNGDGHVDNQFGNVLSSLGGSFGFDIAGATATGVAAGQSTSSNCAAMMEHPLWTLPLKRSGTSEKRRSRRRQPIGDAAE